MQGPVSVNVGVGDVMERLPAFIADLEDPCLLLVGTGLPHASESVCVSPRGKDEGTESIGALDPRRRRSGRER